MNAERRKALSQAIELLNQAEAMIEAVADAEQEARDNLPDNLQDGARAQAMDDAIDTLQNVSDAFDDIRSSLDPLLRPSM